MFLEILKITIPSLIVFITAYYVLKTVLQKENENRKVQIILQNQKIITPIRLQAYERVILFLERISPNSIIMRLQTPNMTVQQLQKEMLITIRSEFEHNLSQQLYLSIDAWEQVKIAKEKTIKLINSAAEECSPTDLAIKLSQNIFEKLIEMEKSPTQEAINFIKEEIKTLY
jgi:putative sterol carrier protein